MDEKVDPNPLGFRKQTPLHKAAGRGQERAVELLLRNSNVDVTRADVDENTALDLAVAGHHVKVVERLFAAPPENEHVDKRNGKTKTAPQIAVETKDYIRNNIRSDPNRW